jgi:hypothetical protein
MTRHILLVSTNAKEGRDEEFNRWYNSVHIPEVLGVEGVVAAQRFEAVEVVLGLVEHRYLAIYEIEAEDAEAALTALLQAMPDMVMTEAFSLRDSAAFLCSPMGPKAFAQTAPVTDGGQSST